MRLGVHLPVAGKGASEHHPGGSGGGRTHRIGLGMVLGAADAADGAATLVIFDGDTIRETIESFRTAAGAAGQDAETLPIMLQVTGNVTAEPLDERGPLLGSTDQVAADLDQATKLGHRARLLEL
jgi:hypothetical protein